MLKLTRALFAAAFALAMLYSPAAFAIPEDMLGCPTTQCYDCWIDIVDGSGDGFGQYIDNPDDGDPEVVDGGGTGDDPNDQPTVSGS